MERIKVTKQIVSFGGLEIRRRKLIREGNPMEGKSRHLVSMGGIRKEVIDIGDPFDGPIYIVDEVDMGPPDAELGSFYTSDQEDSEKAAWKESGEEMRKCDDDFCEKNHIC